MKKDTNLSDVRASHAKVSREMNGRFAVVVSTRLSPRRTIWGVQFWNIDMIAKVFSTNTDGTVSTFQGYL